MSRLARTPILSVLTFCVAAGAIGGCSFDETKFDDDPADGSDTISSDIGVDDGAGRETGDTSDACAPVDEECNGRDDDCDGEVDEGACYIWRLRAGGETWRGFGRDPANSGNAPEQAIRAAFDLEQLDQAIVLTNETFQTFTPSSMHWGEQAALADIEPGLEEAYIYAARSFPAAFYQRTAGQDAIQIIAEKNGGAAVWAATFLPSEPRFDFSQVGEPLNAHRDSEHAPPAWSAYTASWLDNTNARGWVDRELRHVCPEKISNDNTEPLVNYLAIVADEGLYFAEPVICLRYFASGAYAESAPGRILGAPPVDRIGAAMFHQGDLWIFAAD